MKHLGRLIGAAIITFLALIPSVGRAEESQKPTIIISEVAWGGSSKSTADEWIELTNLSEAPIDISGWSIEGAASGDVPLIIPSGLVEPRATHLIANYDAENEKTALAHAPNFITTAISLSNSASRLVLKDGAGTVVDMAGNGGPPFAGSTGPTTSNPEKRFASMVRKNAAISGDVAEVWVSTAEQAGWDTDATEFGTPGTTEVWFRVQESTSTEPESMTPPAVQDDQETSTASPSTETPPTPSSISIIYPPGTLVINELLPNPTEDEEWVEIFNPYNNVIPLNGWKIRDASGKAVDLPRQLLGWQQFVVVRRGSGWLNNNAETVELVDPMGNIIDHVEYAKEAKPTKGETIMRDEKLALTITTTPTPGAPNVLAVADQPTPIPTPPALEPPATPPAASVAVITTTQDEQPTLTVMPTLTPSAIVATAATERPTEKTVPKTTSTKKTATTKPVIKTVPLSSIQNLTSRTRVKIEGIVTAGASVFPNNTMYLQDGDAGVEVIKPNGRLTSFKIGDRLKLTGTIAVKEGHKRISLSSSDTIEKTEETETPSITETTINDLDEKFLDRLIKTRGKVSYVIGKKTVLEDQGAHLPIEIRPVIGDAPKMDAGTELSITGILIGQSGELVLVPRMADDIQFVQTSPPATLEIRGKEMKKERDERTAIMLTVSGILAIAGFAIKHFLL